MATKELFLKKKGTEKEIKIDISKQLAKIISKNYELLKELGKY